MVTPSVTNCIYNELETPPKRVNSCTLTFRLSACRQILIKTAHAHFEVACRRLHVAVGALIYVSSMLYILFFILERGVCKGYARPVRRPGMGEVGRGRPRFEQGVRGRQGRTPLPGCCQVRNLSAIARLKGLKPVDC